MTREEPEMWSGGDVGTWAAATVLSLSDPADPWEASHLGSFLDKGLGLPHGSGAWGWAWGERSGKTEGPCVCACACAGGSLA